MDKGEKQYDFYFLADLEKKQVGCVLLQAAYGGSNIIANNVNANCWFVAPTENMKMYGANQEDVPKISQFFEDALKEKQNETISNSIS